MNKIRTRFAPSPTGFMHIGNLRTALYAYLLARKNNGNFILRIEDTDQDRYVESSIKLIYETLSIAGLKYDEGPNVGGKYGPYVQSERAEIYIKYANELIKNGFAYRCFCTEERIRTLRESLGKEKKGFKYDGHCKLLTKDEIANKLNQKIPYVIRQIIPKNKIVSFNDLLFGEIKTNSDELDEGVLIKSSGLPTYNFANVIDDHLMGISHVIRGIEYISSVPKYVLLYESFEWEVPIQVHLPPIMKSSTKKFSKREGDASFLDLLKKGYLKDAILNYIVLLGWNPKNNRELFSLKDLEEIFDISGLNKAPAIFDIKKLNWFNEHYIKSMNIVSFHKICLEYYPESLKTNVNIDLIKVSKLLQDRISYLGEIVNSINFLENLPDYSVTLFENKKMKSDIKTSENVMRDVLSKIHDISLWEETNIENMFSVIMQKLNLSKGQVLWPLRAALTGKEFSPGGAIEIASILSREEVISRLNIALSKIEKWYTIKTSLIV